MAVTLKGNNGTYEGTSEDNKPLDVPVNTEFNELDTGKTYYFDGETWNEEPPCEGSGFTPTAEQLVAMNSGVTTEDVAQIATNENNISLKANISDLSTAKANLQAQIDEIGVIKTQSTWTWVMKHISTNGNLTSNNNKNIVFEDPVNAIATSTISVDTGYKYQYALYDKDTGVFIERVTWKTDPTTLNANYKIRVELSDLSESVLTDYSIAEHLHANIYSSIVTTKSKVIEDSEKIEMIEATVSDFDKETENALRQSNNIVNAIGIDSFKEKMLEVAEPTAYKSWPFVGVAGGKLLCLYSVGTSHTDAHSSIYVKYSDNGAIWSADRGIISTDSQRENVTGKGYDEDGELIFWVRRGAPGDSDTTFELWKATDYKTFEQVSTPTFATANGHIGDIVNVPGHGLFAFWNTYGNERSWGYAKSTDNGETWTETTIETGQTTTSCPVEMSAVYLGNGKILVMGRQDWDGNYGMFQIQSDDYGETFTKHSTNINYSGSTPSVLYDSESDTISMYCYLRYTGELSLFTTLSETVWNNPTSWTSGTVIATAATGGNAGNVNACQFGDIQIASFYSGDSTNTGIYATIV